VIKTVRATEATCSVSDFKGSLLWKCWSARVRRLHATYHSRHL